MGIMAAGVHHAGVTRAVGDVILLSDGQRVEIGAKGDDRNVPRWVTGNFRDNSSVVRPQLIANARGRQLLGDKRGRLMLIAAQLGTGMQVSADLENFRFKLGNGTL